jgi:quercetin dioxygenase-like cupin family protein
MPNDNTPGSENNERLRTAPQERFSGNHHHFDIQSELQRLRAEDHQGQHGRRQVTLLHHGPISQVLFYFQAGGEFPHHTAHGWVTIQVLEGQLTVEVGEHSHELAAGHLLMLDPDLPHSVRAIQESAMLLTVHIQVEGKPTPLTLGPNE